MDEPLVQVEVVVNFDGMRRGQVGEVELNGRIQALVDRGYLKLLGHVDVPPVASVLHALPEPTETPAKRSRPSRAKRSATTTPPEDVTPTPEDSDGDSQGDTDLE